MSLFTEQVDGAIAATTFLAPSNILWFGAPAVRGGARRIGCAFPRELERKAVLAGLRALLYQSFYGTGGAMPWSPDLEHRSAPPDVAPFVQRLSEANGGAGYLEPGWELTGADGDELIVARDGLRVRITARECQRAGGGTTVEVRFPKEFRHLLPGFYLAAGDEAAALGHALVRLYWNLTGDGAVELLRAATRVLNEARIPYQIKVLTYLGNPRRYDATVLYLAKDDYARATPLLARIRSEVSAHLRPGEPALSKPLTRGVGLAEDPGSGTSFGEHRCGLLAEGLLLAYEAGAGSRSERAEVIAQHFAAHGIELEKAPYLNPGSTDVYAAWVDAEPPARHVAAHRSPELSPARCLETAVAIGHRICEGAVWSGERCNWVGYAVDGTRRLVCRALAPSLYSGTSGVALFLADLHAATGDARVRATAIAAMRQALSRAHDVPPGTRLGLYSGWTGLAFAAARVGVRARDDAMTEQARELLRTLVTTRDISHVDVIAGAAGAVLGWLSLAVLLPGTTVLDACVRLGDVLIERAEKRSIRSSGRTARWSWRLPDTPRDRALTGFAHGAAGIAVALLELARASGDVRYRDAATHAFAFEELLFDPAAKNWPDLRGVPARGGSRGRVFPCATVWCHGAPGIALSRLRAYEITADPRRKAEAAIALDTTREQTRRALAASTMGFSLCHGFAGNAEILLAGARQLGEESAGAPALIDDIARTGIERHAADGSWPGGAGGPTPALMVGRAGTGHFYLRLYDPAIPSVLLPTAATH